MRTILVDRRFVKPAITSQFEICSVPFQVDTWKGCVYDCVYCFARDMVNFNRSSRRKTNRKHSFDQLEPNDPGEFLRWIRDKVGCVVNRSDAVQVALDMRLPLKIGAMSDPCPPQEIHARVTLMFLETLALLDYPVQIQTKNPKVLYHVLNSLGPGCNVVASVSVSSLDDEWCRTVECGAPTARTRLKWVEKIVGLGYPVMIKIQPACYPRIVYELPDIVAMARDVGAWAFNTEGLKIKRAVFFDWDRQWFLSVFGDVYDQYESHYGQQELSDMVLRDVFKSEYMAIAKQCSLESGLKWFSADNSPLGVGYGYECCGTEKLRSYSLFDYNLRSSAFGVMNEDNPLCACEAKCVWSAVMNRFRFRDLHTIKDVVDYAFEHRKFWVLHDAAITM